ncbi:hypothetical protein POM88_052420 [Heracleum sosnowskyi]|uniref:Uncharacterized protein n=1 Tax=Heracleum sosnowskyi TaxID=360622 RepID=A0AAD8GQK9_9APIA|nr:hypothetical protein POM88_052420 [Heracleum sosnowskyi]
MRNLPLRLMENSVSDFEKPCLPPTSFPSLSDGQFSVVCKSWRDSVSKIKKPCLPLTGVPFFCLDENVAPEAILEYDPTQDYSVVEDNDEEDNDEFDDEQNSIEDGDGDSEGEGEGDGDGDNDGDDSDSGRVAEFDTPAQLLEDKSSMFFK